MNGFTGMCTVMTIWGAWALRAYLELVEASVNINVGHIIT